MNIFVKRKLKLKLNRGSFVCVCKNGSCTLWEWSLEGDSASIGENTICPDIGKKADIYFGKTVTPQFFDQTRPDLQYECVFRKWHGESKSVFGKTHLVGNELEEWPTSSFYDQRCWNFWTEQILDPNKDSLQTFIRWSDETEKLAWQDFEFNGWENLHQVFKAT